MTSRSIKNADNLEIFYGDKAGSWRAAGGVPGSSIACPTRAGCRCGHKFFSDSYLANFAQKGQSAPAPVSGIGLIDTGASHTAIDETVVKTLQLPTIRTMDMGHAGGVSRRSVHFVSLEIVGGFGKIGEIEVICCDLRNQNLIALIGRDILAVCEFHYSGVSGYMSLSM